MKIVILLFSCVGGIFVRRNEPWTLLLCQFFDVRTQPHSRVFYEEFLMSNYSGSVQEYFRVASDGLYTINGSNVVGWFRLPYTRPKIHELVRQRSATHGVIADSRAFSSKIAQLCLRAAKINRFLLHDRTITIVNAGNYAIFTADNGILLSPPYTMTSALVHEMVHSFNIGHSFSDRNVFVYPHAERGEYDDRFDLMSTSNAFMFHDTYGFNGPGLSGPHLDYLGWLPQDRILYFRSPGSTVVRIASLSVAREASRDPLLILVPHDRDNAQLVYTIEYRTPHGLDQGIEEKAIVLHKVKSKQGYLHSYLLAMGPKFGLGEGNTYFRLLNGIEPRPFLRVKVISFFETAAVIEVQSTFSPTRCRSDEVAETVDNVTVCTQWNKSDQQRFSNSNLKYLKLKQKTYQEFYSKKTFGLNACVEGYVWRAGDSRDYTCVSEASRTRAEWQSNRLISSEECSRGHRRREGFPGDSACVSQTEYELTQVENQLAIHKLAYQKFFNGIDELA